MTELDSSNTFSQAPEPKEAPPPSEGTQYSHGTQNPSSDRVPVPWVRVVCKVPNVPSPNLREIFAVRAHGFFTLSSTVPNASPPSVWKDVNLLGRTGPGEKIMAVHNSVVPRLDEY